MLLSRRVTTTRHCIAYLASTLRYTPAAGSGLPGGLPLIKKTTSHRSSVSSTSSEMGPSPCSSEVRLLRCSFESILEVVFFGFFHLFLFFFLGEGGITAMPPSLLHSHPQVFVNMGEKG